MHHLARGPRRAGRRHRPDARADRLGDGRDPGRRGDAGPDRRLRGRAARQGRDGRGGRPASSTRCTPTRPPISVPGRLLDVVGTGGDRSMSVNISTMAAIVAAGAGRPGGQARQPVGVVAVRLGRRPRGARRPARPARRPGRRASRTRPASRSASRRRSTPRCGTPPCPGASSASARPSTSSARWPTRPGPPPRRSAAPTRGWRR